MMNTLLLLKATKEMIKQFDNVKNDKERKEKCLEMLWKTFDLMKDESEFLYELSQWNCYVYKWKYVDFTILRKNNKFVLRASHNKYCWKYVDYNTIFEINQNENLRYIMLQLEHIDETF